MKVITIIAVLFIFSSGLIDQSAALYLKEKLNFVRISKKGHRELKLFFRKTYSESFFAESDYDLIPAFMLTERKKVKKDSTSLIYCLEPQKYSSHYAIILFKNEYRGVVNLINHTYISKPFYNLSKDNDSQLDSFDGSDLNVKYYRAWARVNEPSVEFVFSVVGFENYWWFIEDNKLFIFDIKRQKNINEDEFRIIYNL